MPFHKGSLWRKWDLHFHTPSSYDYQNRAITNQEIIDTLVANNVRVVAITDHNTIDVERIHELQKLGEGKITILPGIELRSELGGSTSVHFIGIFSEKCDIEEVWHNLSAKLELTDVQVSKKGGQERVYCDLKEAASVIHQNDGLVSIHAGKKSNSLENISGRDLFKQAVKTDLLLDAVDILEVGHKQDTQAYDEIVFPAIGSRLPLITASDNHSISNYSIRECCWIKADPCFHGLLQVLVEPVDRIFIGDKPEKRHVVATNPTKYIRSIQVSKQSDVLEEHWFDGTNLDLNHDLVAIIGNKGSGKSALADIIGLLGNTWNSQSFSFLNKKRFCTPRDNRSEHFVATLIWESGTSEVFPLSRATNHNQPEKLKLIPQGLFEEICNDLANGTDNKFDKELKKVIFSHVSSAERLGQSSLDDVISYLTNETHDAIAIQKSQLHDINEKIVSIEKQLTQEHREKLKSLLEIRQEELEAHEKTKPGEVLAPTGPETGEMASLSVELGKLLATQESIRQEIATTENADKQNALMLSVSDRIFSQVTNFQEKYRLFKSELGTELEKIGLTFEQVVAFQVQTDPVLDKQKELKIEQIAIKHKLDPVHPDGLTSRSKAIAFGIENLQSKMDEPLKRYEAYKRDLQIWQTKKNLLIGTAKNEGSITYYEEELKELDKLPQSLYLLNESRKKLVQQIFEEIERLVSVYRKLYKPVQQFSNQFEFSRKAFELQFDVSIVDMELESRFFDWVARNVAGSFYGSDAEKVLREIIQHHDLNSVEGVLEFLDDLTAHLTTDKRDTKAIRVSIENQLRKGRTVTEFYDYLFSLDYLRPRFVLKLDEKELNQLSPGERGALLLMFYLLVDNDTIPLVIDQPEENLDNQTVYKMLVEAIKLAKRKRQIIVVTHNPNLAVVCDAEQIICCSIDKQDGYKIQYVTGSIENSEINAKILDILEGTPPAFNNRQRKYAPFSGLRR